MIASIFNKAARGIIVAFFNHQSAKKCQALAVKYLEKPYTPLYDVVHHNTHAINFHFPDYLLAVSFVAAVVKNLILPVDYSVIDKYSECLLHSFFLRAVMLQLTILPACREKQPHPKERSQVWFLLDSTHDLMYSGHTTWFIFFGHLIIDEHIGLHVLGLIMQYVFPIFLILARQHYTIDVIVSMLVFYWMAN